jgi:hypothetical protein
MKKLNAISVLLFSLIGMIFFNCSNEETEKNLFDESLNKVEQIVDTSIPSDMEGIIFGNIALPKGTTSKISENGSRLDFMLPENYLYIATDSNGTAFFANRGSYTCTSTCTGGCDVVKLGDVVGCSSCPEGSTATCVGQHGVPTVENRSDYSHLIGDGNNGGLINVESGINFITNISKRSTLNENIPNFDILMRHPKIKTEFDKFFDKIWNDNLPNKDNSISVLMEVYGKTISILIPVETYQSSNIQFINGDAVTCNCSSGSTGCTLQNIKKGFIVVGQTCVAGSCESCTMSW